MHAVLVIIIQSYPEYEADETIASIQLGLIAWFTLEYMMRWIAVRPSWKVPRLVNHKLVNHKLQSGGVVFSLEG